MRSAGKMNANNPARPFKVRAVGRQSDRTVRGVFPGKNTPDDKQVGLRPAEGLCATGRHCLRRAVLAVGDSSSVRLQDQLQTRCTGGAGLWDMTPLCLAVFAFSVFFREEVKRNI